MPPEPGGLSGLVALAGVPAVGKSTVARALVPVARVRGAQAVLVNPDGIARQRFGSVANAREAERMSTVWAIAHARIGAALALGRLVVVDATLVDPSTRHGLLCIAEEQSVRTTLIVFMSSAETFERNAARSGDERVPGAAMNAMLAQWPAQVGVIRSEPWDLVIEAADLSEPYFEPDPWGLRDAVLEARPTRPGEQVVRPD